MINEHYRHPRNHRAVARATLERRGSNPLCGDEIDVSIRIDAQSEGIDDIGCISRGCSMVRASASIMTELVMHHSLAEALEFTHALRGTASALAGVSSQSMHQIEELRSLQMLYPARVKCALLPWNTLGQIIDEYRASA